MTPAQAFKAPREFRSSGRWLMYPSPEATKRDVERWNLENPGRRLATGSHMTLVRMDDNGEQEVFMSDVEWHDHRRVLELAHGRVVVTGLGLGCIVRAMFARGRVDHITVVEREADVIALVWPRLAATYGARLALHEADALTGPMPAGRFDLAWHDIWPTTTAMNIPEMWKLRRRYDKVARRQLCWAEGLAWRQLRDRTRAHLCAVIENRGG